MNNGNGNDGGRKRFKRNEEVRILELDGQVSSLTYLIGPESETEDVRADRKGYVILAEKEGTRKIKVHFRRILPLDVDNKAPVIESGDRFIALCPQCGTGIGVTSNSQNIDCPDCGTFKLYWLGVKPMADAATEKSPPKKAKEDKTKAEKLIKKEPEPVIPDLDEYKSLPNCELWEKLGVKFDHPTIDVKSYVLLLIVDDKPRKLCFNTYNNTLGKKGEPLPIQNFLEDKPVKGARSATPWYYINDVDKTKAKLTKDGYTLIE